MEQALLRAARLLGPSWGSGQRRVVLVAPALTVHTASVEEQRPPAEVPLETVRDLLADPARLRSRIPAVLAADDIDRADPLRSIGHGPTRIQDADPDPGDVLLDIAPEAEVEVETDGLAVLLADRLDGTTEDRERALPAPPGCCCRCCGSSSTPTAATSSRPGPGPAAVSPTRSGARPAKHRPAAHWARRGRWRRPCGSWCPTGPLRPAGSVIPSARYSEGVGVSEP
ncbi:hypothetical protein [Kitasatospora griseola]